MLVVPVLGTATKTHSSLCEIISDPKTLKTAAEDAASSTPGPFEASYRQAH